MCLLTSLILVVIFLIQVKCARILCAFPVTSVSHQVVFQPIWRELALKGHQVTVLTPNPLKDPSLTTLKEIDLSKSYDVVRNLSYQSVLTNSIRLPAITGPFYYMYSIVVMSELINPELQLLIADQNAKFDLLIVQNNLPTMQALSERFNCPMIGISVSALFFLGPDIIGNSPNLALNPDVQLKVREKLNFFDRFNSVLYTTWHRYHYQNTVIPRENAIAKKYINNKGPYLSETNSNITLLLLNINSITYTIRPTVPTLIDMDSFYVKNTGELPFELEQELDDTKNGFIYFSLGSNVKSTNLSIEVRKKLLSCFSELPYKILWKWEDKELPGKPSNVVIKKWFPQTDILAHRNIKVFLMQGGIQSIDEAIAFNVPLVTMPIYLDQFSNTDKIVNLGIAKTFDLFEATKDDMRAIISEVAENPVYKERIKEVASLVSDVPFNSLNKTIWWIEYVIRHRDTSFLRSPVLDLSWYQESLLDVVVCIFICISLLVLMLYKICFIFCK